ncbi:MAG: hypothetical protein A3C80_01940 [Candidatus Ryanbacteria bacterium RIFCSPHIGHO2_02_FULL_45_43]|uniref:Uncharacterized protein n=1 Tax=Candidatus Ryanbacteria bacterium RIFCSPHIGHO2_01_45_13 TaxID=1802112 RepID=A0A1G2FZK0_9BACT|nr:MAG: hypothetical protein A2718_02770 [Candidatus Ryanbacteria bacterium RIFCSPHIGHO2_01_FULL_44_130]OGZ43001.1 MAG: hypothetical protein A2W41_02715 [Candidatus Ryanbacteria bacterium RIFCSPHIGHO2_01_45_13]OGZ48706.1 MAG: hypothetical protein A3C80_01940 [Candidatus Ryanbacteria bacterium RIFCSPHIGHO2_02_FULL_45_43]OGZ50646.1 MAG: hypothetical protein A3E55_03420 [Candidatus Ryanbacteria bacterium RIFCSPHIGHO2_12_FULL_44_20]OGZ51952.1 MAG: hypothetical protein A3A17_00795 [Candidatus Ryanba
MIKKSRHTKRNVTWGFGLAATAIGTYFLYGKEKIKNRRKVKGWMLKVKGEVLEKIERFKQVDKATYNKAIDDVARRYRKLRNVSNKELALLIKELKQHWHEVKKASVRKNTNTSRK